MSPKLARALWLLPALIVLVLICGTILHAWRAPYLGAVWDARGQGIQFDIYDANQPPEVDGDQLRYLQPVMGTARELPFDLLVLSTPLVPRDGAADLAQILRVPMDQNGFFLEAHAKLRPLDFATDGMFVCGSARYPASLEEAHARLKDTHRVEIVIEEGAQHCLVGVPEIGKGGRAGEEVGQVPRVQKAHQVQNRARIRDILAQGGLVVGKQVGVHADELEQG